jgi:hypothetical protein
MAQQGNGRGEPKNATQVVTEINAVVQRVADTSLDQLDEAILDLGNLRDFMHDEGARIQRDISGFLQLNQAALGTAKLINDKIWTEPQETASPIPLPPPT